MGRLSRAAGGPPRRGERLAATVAEARDRLAAGGEDRIVFPAVPPDLEDLPGLPPGARIDVPYSEESLPAYRERGRGLRVRVACRDFPGLAALAAALRRLSAHGLPGVVVDAGALGPEEGRALLDLFLHDPAIVQPIEPFAGLLFGAAHRRRIGLWDAAPLSPGPDRDPDEFLFALPREHPGCLACASFPLCEGYGLWAGGCATWKAILRGIAAAAREIPRNRGGAVPARAPELRQNGRADAAEIG